jgi:uncharacterized protein (TIGR03437 family)
MDFSGALLIADTFNHKLRRVGHDGIIETIAGDGTPGDEGDGEIALAARFRLPTSIAVDPSGALYVADHENRRIRKLTPVLVPPDPIVEAPMVELLHAATLRPGPLAAGQLVIARSQDLRFTVNEQPVVPLSVSRGEITFLAPHGATEMRVNRQAVKLERTAPGIFAQNGSGQAVAINEDNSLNSERNPAARGSVVALYLTGEGTAWKDAIEVTVGQARAEVVFAGLVPAFPGVFQINIRLPGMFTPPGIRPLAVSIGGVVSQPGVVISVF